MGWVSAPRFGPETHAPVASSLTGRVGGRKAVINSSPVTAVEPRGVSTREANTPRTRARSAGWRVAASPQARVSRASQGRTASCTHALPLAALRGPVDPRPRPEPPLGQLPLRLRELLDDRVVLGQAQAPAVLQLLRQPEPRGRGRGEDDQRVGVLAVPVKPRLPEA